MGNKVLVLVPEQSSFETEKEILNLVSERNFKYVNILTFSRLREFICQDSARTSREKLSCGARSIFMSMAIEKVKKDLKLYNKSSDDCEMINMFIDILKEIKACCLSYQDIENACNIMENGTLRQKLEETLKIIKTYESLIEGKFFDPLDDFTYLYKIIKDEKIFSGYTVFADSYDGFTNQQLDILVEIIMQSKDSYITFCTDTEVTLNSNIVSEDLFYPVNRNIRNILYELNEKNFTNVKTIFLKNSVRFKNMELCEVEKNFLSPSKSREVFNHCEKVHIYSASDMYDECEFVAMTIRKTVIEKGYRYRDFAVIARDIKTYQETLKNTLTEYDIPYFTDEPEKVMDKTLLCAVFSAFEAVISGFESRSILRYLKTGLAGLNIDEISILENYVLLWDIDEARWRYDFTMHPSGFSRAMTPEDETLLEEINKLRQRVICPLLEFKSKITNKAGDEISRAVYEFIKAVQMDENLRDLCKKLIAEEDINSAQEQGRLWDMLIKALEQTALSLKGIKVTPKRYMELLRLVIDSQDISFIPQGLDEVALGSIDRIKLENAKVVFIIGASNGEFPQSPSQFGVFSDKERKKLISNGLNVYDMIDGMITQEKFLAYRAVSIASDSLYISWPSSSVSGESKFPSEIVKEIQSILPGIQIKDKYMIKTEDWLWAKKPAFDICTRNWSENSDISHALKNYFTSQPDYYAKIVALKRAINKGKVQKISEEKSLQLFGKNLRLSPSQLSKFYLCKFGYFCNYGLKAQQRKAAQFDLIEYGLMVHFVLEKFFKAYANDSFLNIPENQLKEQVNTFMEAYINENLGGWDGKSARFKYLFLRCAKALEFLVLKLIEEFKQSKFKPVDFELSISDAPDIKPAVWQIGHNRFVQIDGKIDRVDMMNLENGKYVRVIDYKTGKQEFKIANLLNGINMQMAIYLMILVKNGKGRYQGAVPSGILYMPLGIPGMISENYCDDFSEYRTKIYKKMRMTGSILEDSVAVEGMEKDKKGLFIPVTEKNGKLDGKDCLIGSTGMNLIVEYVKKKILDMAMEIKDGNIAVTPLSWEDSNSCKWCSYNCICGFEGEKYQEITNKLSQDDVLQQIKGELEHASTKSNTL